VDRRDFLQQVRSGLGGVVLGGATAGTLLASFPPDSETSKSVLRPRPWEVFQRQAFDPRHAHDHEPGGPKLGFANVPLVIEQTPIPGALWQYRTTLREGSLGRALDWTEFDPTFADNRLVASLRIPAGGWYRLEIRALQNNQTVAAAAVDPVGVGEVLVIAGQSYAEGANDELLKIEDPAGRVAAFDVVREQWRIAHDPQPNINTGGTIWPPLGDLLVPLTRVPIGFVNVAVGGTASRQWMPGEGLFQNLAEAGKKVGKFRAVLWQQGESDVIERTSTEKYVANLLAIREALAKIWGWEPPWLLAKSTLHPTVYQRPEEEGWIRAAIDELCRKPGFRPGPDTDILAGENRGGIGTRRHFTGIGQRRAAWLWFAAVWQELHRSPAELPNP
jgi:Carbohydrate esterase, sialic acid-specific acetylesterase